MTLDELFPRNEDEIDADICALIDLGVTDPEICWIMGVKGGRVTAMREELDRLDVEEGA